MYIMLCFPLVICYYVIKNITAAYNLNISCQEQLYGAKLSKMRNFFSKPQWLEMLNLPQNFHTKNSIKISLERLLHINIY